MGPESVQNVDHVWIEFPYSRFGKVRIGRFEEGISIEIACLRRDSIDNLINQFPPPTLVVVLAWTFDRRTDRQDNRYDRRYGY